MADLWVECGELAAGARACAAGEPPAEEERAGFGHWAEPVRIGWDQRSGTRVRVLDRWPIGGIQEERTMLSLLGRYAAKRRRVH